MSNARCLAYLDEGTICGEPATMTDLSAGMTLCTQHGVSAKLAGHDVRVSAIYDKAPAEPGVEGDQS